MQHSKRTGTKQKFYPTTNLTVNHSYPNQLIILNGCLGLILYEKQNLKMHTEVSGRSVFKPAVQKLQKKKKRETLELLKTVACLTYFALCNSTK